MVVDSRYTKGKISSPSFDPPSGFWQQLKRMRGNTLASICCYWLIVFIDWRIRKGIIAREQQRSLARRVHLCSIRSGGGKYQKFWCSFVNYKTFRCSYVNTKSFAAVA